MHFSIFFGLQIAAVLVTLPSFKAYDYGEIRKWNASCYPKDTCSVPRDLDDSDVHNCDCSSLCVLYNSCCIDSPFLNISSQYERTASCKSAGVSGKSVFMIDVCSNRYKGPAAIRRRCEQPSKNWSDPLNNVPVTNKRSLKTYKSLFCGICNNENVKELVMWQVMLDCSTLTDYMEVCVKNKDFVLNNMMYIREKGIWGLWSWDSQTDWKFRYLTINYKMPPSLNDSVKECRPSLKSECPPTWTDARTKRLCESYMGAVYFGSKAFRNVHCALCNGVRNFTTMSCHDTNSLVYKSPVMSFGILLDIDLTDGDKVGNVDNKCSEGQIYDPFSKKCRAIECPIPGYSLKDGKCAAD